MNGQPCTFRSLLERVGRVEVPLLQRDYAQGRRDPDTLEKRTRFVDALADALLAPEPRSLDLDFVYGRRRQGLGTSDAGPAPADRLEPIDGQQRLTTLFLLHWYAACCEGRLDDLRQWAWSDEAGCHFTYRTRPAAREFIDALMGDARPGPGWPGTNGEKPSTWIVDQSWFSASWRRDPTVQGCLVMLDAIHGRLEGQMPKGPEIYERLTSTEVPRVRFRLLELEDFLLADDLYLKMNARGKALTSFEVFKAQLEAFASRELADQAAPHLTSKPWRRYLEEQLDGAWTDMLWRTGAHDAPNSLDDRFMHLLRAIALVGLDLRKAADEDEDNPPNAVASNKEHQRRVREALEHLLDTPQPSFSALREHGCVDRRFFETLTRLLDILSHEPGAPSFLGRTDYLHEGDLFERVLRGRSARETDGLTFTDWVKFRAWCAYLLAAPSVRSTEGGRESLHDWIRLVANLAHNSDITRVEVLMGALRWVTLAAEQAAGPGLLAIVADGSLEIEVFARAQRAQEQLKAALILKDGRWRTLIEKAECHRYFRGDIGFLLSFSGIQAAWLHAKGCHWTTDEDERLRQSFSSWYAKACAIFPDAEKVDPARFPEFLWERALLATGNYLLPRGSNFSLLDDSTPEASWKRLLRDPPDAEAAKRRDIVRRVLERVDPDRPTHSLQQVIAAGVQGADPDGWRTLLVGDQRHLQFCRKRMLRFVGGRVLLLEKERLSAAHTDAHLLAIALHLGDRDDLGVWKLEKPLARKSFDPLRISAARTQPDYKLQIEWGVGSSLDVTASLIDPDVSLGVPWKDNGGGSWTRSAANMAEAEEAFLEIVRLSN